MKTLFILGSVVIILLLSSPNKAEAQKTKATNEVNQGAAIAETGYYITLFRCHACVLSPRQQDAILSFRAFGISAFYGNPTYDKPYENIEFVEKVSVRYPNPVLMTLFVGPFETEAAAQRVVSKIPSILRKQIAEDKQSDEPMGLYEVEVRRVRSDKITGSFANLRPEDFVIRPGVGVGRILIGNSRDEVLAVLGEPRDKEDESDTWRSGDEYLMVSYVDGVVNHISVSSSKFRTDSGLTSASSSLQFLRAFPTRVKYCCVSNGASASWEWTCWDAVNKGIALHKGSQIEIVVHKVNEAFMQYESGDECNPCK